MSTRDNQRLAATLADQLRRDIEALPPDHPMRRLAAPTDATIARRQAAERAAEAAENAAHDARIADFRRRLAAIEGKLR